MGSRGCWGGSGRGFGRTSIAWERLISSNSWMELCCVSVCGLTGRVLRGESEGSSRGTGAGSGGGAGREEGSGGRTLEYHNNIPSLHLKSLI